MEARPWRDRADRGNESRTTCISHSAALPCRTSSTPTTSPSSPTRTLPPSTPPSRALTRQAPPSRSPSSTVPSTGFSPGKNTSPSPTSSRPSGNHPLSPAAHSSSSPGAKSSTSTASTGNATNPCICAPPPSLRGTEVKYTSANTSRAQTTADSSVARYAQAIRSAPRSHPPIQSVHKALEGELRPDKLVVHVVSDEERFGLRSVVWRHPHSFSHSRSLALCSSLMASPS